MDSVEARERTRVLTDEASWALRDVTRAAVDVDYALARHMGLRPMDYTALSHVFTGNGTLTPRRLSDHLGISTGSTSGLLDRLEQAGHLHRRRDGTDRRQVNLEPSERSVTDVITALSPLFAALEEMADRYTVAERETIADYLRRTAELMRTYAEDIQGFTSPG
ncbi:MarR family winged helix-turn-helix transcriptional regulator [Ornithinimicrobium sp. LYQ121]|uniref:MarR family winged helix-turn-helix transcriptional regulator n=1 Tax=Ornithinimicrobium sp. LYQ121 TaxID=3378801 RepID=UPI003851A116